LSVLRAPISNSKTNFTSNSTPMNTEPLAPRPAATAGAPARSPLRFVPHVARWLLGLPLVVFGLNGFLNFIPPPEGGIAPEAMAFSVALMETGYMMPLIGATQLVVGVLLVVNRFVPLALVLFGPFIVNALAFHVVLEPTGLPMTCVFAALWLYLAWTRRGAYATLFTAR
jgi:hypothetical protein